MSQVNHDFSKTGFAFTSPIKRILFPIAEEDEEECEVQPGPRPGTFSDEESYKWAKPIDVEMTKSRTEESESKKESKLEVNHLASSDQVSFDTSGDLINGLNLLEFRGLFKPVIEIIFNSDGILIQKIRSTLYCFCADIQRDMVEANHRGNRSIGCFGHSFPKKVNPIDVILKSNPIEMTLSPFIIGIAGGTGSGKGQICQAILEKLEESCYDNLQNRVIVIPMSSFYRELSNEEKDLAKKGLYNFDVPGAYDMELLVSTLRKIKLAESPSVPIYDFKTHSIVDGKIILVNSCVDVVLFYGSQAFQNILTRNRMDLKVFVEYDSDLRFSNRVKRDTIKWGRDADSVLQNYKRCIRPGYNLYCAQDKYYADIIMSYGPNSWPAIHLVVNHIKEMISFRESLLKDRRVIGKICDGKNGDEDKSRVSND